MSVWFRKRFASGGLAVVCLLAAPAALALSLHSPAFKDGGQIPTRFGCDGAGVSPPLSIASPPDGTESFAVTVEDPDAPGGTFVHWVVYNLPEKTRALASGASDGNLPSGAVTAHNSYGDADYGGLCPPTGRHHYIFTIFALDDRLDGNLDDAQSLVQAMRGHELDSARLTGIYRRQAGRTHHTDK